MSSPAPVGEKDSAPTTWQRSGDEFARWLGPVVRGALARAALPAAVLLALAGGYSVATGEATALYLFASLFMCALILVDFRVGALLLILMMPVSASQYFPHSLGGIIGLNPLNLIFAGTLASCLLRPLPAVPSGRLVPRPLFWLYLVPIVVAGMIGVAHVPEIPGFFFDMKLISFVSPVGYLRDTLFQPLLLVLFAVLIGAASSRIKRVEALLLALMVSVWIMGLATLAFIYLSGASIAELSSDRSRGFFTPLGIHANSLGRLYAIAYALLLFSFAAAKGAGLRGALMATMGMVVVALTLTFSRGAFFGFVVVNILFLISRRRASTFFFGAIFLGAMALLLPGEVYERVGTGWGNGFDAISAGRLEGIWLPLWSEVWRSPIVGNGLGAILWSDAMRAGLVLQVTHLHNAYLHTLLEMGVLGLALLLAYFVHVWKAFNRLSKDPALSPVRRGFYAGAAAGLTGFLLTGMAGSTLTPMIEQCFLWMAIGMMYGERIDRKES